MQDFTRIIIENHSESEVISPHHIPNIEIKSLDDETPVREDNEVGVI